MTRILADLPYENIESLDRPAAEQGKSRGDILDMIIQWYCQHIERSQ